MVIMAVPLRQPLVEFLRVPDHAKDFTAIRVDNADGEQIGHLGQMTNLPMISPRWCPLLQPLKCCS